MLTGVQADQTFRSGDKLEEANLEETEMEYLYSDGDSYCFMNTSTYTQEFLTEDQIEDVKGLLKENTECDVLLFDGRPIGVTLPNFIDLQVAEVRAMGQGRYCFRKYETGYTGNGPDHTGAPVY